MSDDRESLPDRPRIPRRRSRFVRGYVGLGVAVSLGLVGARATGFTFDDSTENDTVPASVRASPGGYRSFHFWHSGYQGGK
ncbi:MAG TPA: hypothetical protein VMS65_06310 [Polyangiaceae bacterium]|nr:hypothetical protein [Polyangiaceae bacterium]